MNCLSQGSAKYTMNAIDAIHIAVETSRDLPLKVFSPA